MEGDGGSVRPWSQRGREEGERDAQRRVRAQLQRPLAVPLQQEIVAVGDSRHQCKSLVCNHNTFRPGYVGCDKCHSSLLQKTSKTLF